MTDAERTRKLINEIAEMAARVNASFAPDQAKIGAWILAHRKAMADAYSVKAGEHGDG